MQPHSSKHVFSHRIFFPLGPNNSQVLLFPYQEICTPQILFYVTSLYPLIGKSKLVTSRFQRLNTRISNPRDPICQSTLTSFFLYRDFDSIATSPLMMSNLLIYQLPTRDMPKLWYDPITLSLLANSRLRDLECPILGLSPWKLLSSWDLPISATYLPLTPAVPHTALWF